MANRWQHQLELGNHFWISLLVWITLNCGRSTARLVLYPITLFYLIFARDAAQASKEYLSRIQPQHNKWPHVWRHLYSFACVSIDRLFFIAKQTDKFDINIQGLGTLKKYQQENVGCILLVSHIGSFEVMRANAVNTEDFPLHILMDVKHNATTMNLLNSLDPELARGIIDTDQSAPQLALTLREHLKNGDMIGMMADRTANNQPSMPCTLLGSEADFPTGPWLLAGVLKVPVIGCFGSYLGGNRYHVEIHELSEKMELPRAQRQQLLKKHMQSYVDRLEAQIKQAPYNWFNFYDFWRNND